MRSLSPVALLLLCSLASVAARGAEPLFTQQNVLARGTEGYHTFRIPGLVATPGGALLLFADGRVNSGGDIGKMDLILKRSPDGGRTWEKVRTLFTDAGEQTKIGNVSAVLDRQTGEVHAIFCRDLKQAYCLTSKDEGVSFAPPLEITEAFRQFDQPWEFFATGHAHGLQLERGRLLIPIFLSDTARVGAGALKAFHVGVIYSEDHGRHWQPGRTAPEASRMNENTIFETADGSIVMNARTTSAARQAAVSHDGGLTWSPPMASNLRGARCQASTLVTKDPAGKRVLLFSNPASPDRKQLTVRLSYDDGQTWPFAKEIHTGPSAYGDLAQGPDGLIHLAYEAGDKSAYENIALATFNVEWLLSPPQAAPPGPATEETDAAPAAGGPAANGIVVDDKDAVLTGTWAKGAKAGLVGPGYQHDQAQGRGEKSARFTPLIPSAGRYEVRLIYPLTNKSSTRVQVTIASVDGEKTVEVNQQQAPSPLGIFPFNEGTEGSVTISNQGADGFVLIDGVEFRPVDRAAAPAPEPANSLAGSASHVFKTIGDSALKLHLFPPPGLQPSDHRPALILFFGGGWRHGSPDQFARPAAYFASRGLVVILPEYRTKESHRTTPFECVADGKSALRWVRAHAAELGIDPQRIAAGGGSAGGHVAAATATLPIEEAGAATGTSCRPDALILFNPVLDTTASGYGAKVLGDRAEEASPVHHIQPGLPPTVIFHGRADTTAPFENSERFAAEMKKAGNVCTVFGYDGEKHGFYWHEPYYEQTLREADRFLAGLGWIEGEPTVAEKK